MIFRKKQGKITAAQNTQKVFDIEGYSAGAGWGKDPGEEGSSPG